jgi:hypothetical protein
MVTIVCKTVMEGKLKERQWTSPDGWYVDDDAVYDQLDNFSNRRVRITIEEIEEE